MSDDVFLLSNRRRWHPAQFVGHCFVGNDLVIGANGYARYTRNQDAHIIPGLDGAYAIVTEHNGVTVVGTDFTGYHRLFLYRSGSDWAVSNSFWRLVEDATRRRLPITIALESLAAFQMSGSVGNQLTSSQTSVAEITMVSSRDEVHITGTGMPRRVRTEAARHLDEQRLDYPEALATFLRAWRGRMRTVLSSELEVHSDVTGGRDSRSVFALLAASAQSDDELRRVRFIGSAPESRDQQVGSAILARHDLNFGRSAAAGYFTADESIAHWRYHGMGVYGPIYFARQRRHEGHIHFGGGGGESHRAFYSTSDVDALFHARRKAFTDPEMLQRAKDLARNDVARARTGFEAELDDAMLHYRHFRDRLHCGRSPLVANVSLPLASGYLAAASGLMPSVRRERAQVLADILLNLDRELALMPFDQERKNFTTDHVEGMTDVRELMGEVAEPGHVYSGLSSEGHTTPPNRHELHRRMSELLYAAIPGARKLGVISESTISQAIETSATAVDTGNLPHAIAGQPIATVILAGELARVARHRGIATWLPALRRG